jgi:hypothetical protein
VSTAGNGCAGLQPGAEKTKQADISAYCVVIFAEDQSIKPERTTESSGVA